MSREDSSTAPVPPGYHVEAFDEAERAVLGRFFTELDGPSSASDLCVEAVATDVLGSSTSIQAGNCS